MWLENISFPFGGEQMNCLAMWDGRSREKESHNLLQAVSDPAIAHPLLSQVRAQTMDERFLYVEFAFLVSGMVPSCLTNSLLHLIFKGLHHWKSSNLQCGPGVRDYEVAFQTMLADAQSSARTMWPKLVGEIGLQHQRWNKFVGFFILFQKHEISFLNALTLCGGGGGSG
ncbi:hypothetical protein Pint_30181 [Pistacia integerrima]|uniref:Uncharacterized protein n=1 Tax=Pistacia integerrima TaxID=434235 RepID=A0ACC0X0T2_9ROSI|nr:hypothetical protein Pint_30181 [Pistacia integerrima]